MTTPNLIENSHPWLADVRQLIGTSRQRLATTDNAELTQLCWQVGKRINDELLHGKSTLSTVRRELTAI